MKNNKKGFVNIVWIGAIVVVLAVVGYAIFLNSLPCGDSRNPLSAFVSCAKAEWFWKTYTNTKYGYELKYPDNVGIVNEESSDYAGPPSNPEEDMLLLADKENTFYIEIDKNVVKVIKKSTLSDQILSTFKFTK